jgi:hypothetical protein
VDDKDKWNRGEATGKKWIMSYLEFGGRSLTIPRKNIEIRPETFLTTTIKIYLHIQIKSFYLCAAHENNGQ